MAEDTTVTGLNVGATSKRSTHSSVVKSTYVYGSELLHSSDVEFTIFYIPNGNTIAWRTIAFATVATTFGQKHKNSFAFDYAKWFKAMITVMEHSIHNDVDAATA